MTKLYGTVYTGNQEEALNRALVEAREYFGRESVNVELREATPHVRTFAGTVEVFATDYVAWIDG